MSDEPQLSKAEHLKAGSRQLRGAIAEELLLPHEPFSGSSVTLLKHHGTYQQDNRDNRHGESGKTYSCMVRSRVPGGKVTAEQFLAELEL